MTRRGLAIVLILTVALAGCMGGPTSSDAEGTPADGTPASGSNDVSGDQVPGVSDGILANASALTHANEDALAESGGEIRVSQSEGDRTFAYRARIGSGLSTYALSGTVPAAGGQQTSVELWSNESMQFVRMNSSDGVRYHVAERERMGVNSLTAVERYLAAGNFTLHNESTGDGSVVFTADGVVSADERPAAFTNLSSFSGRLVVTESGQIHNLTVSAVDDGRDITYQYELERTGVDRVSKPNWVSGVPESATLRIDLEVRPVNDSYLAIENVGEDPVPRNSEITVSTDGTSGSAVLQTRLERGDTRYVYFHATDGSLRISEERPTGPDAEELSSPVSVTIVTDDGVTLLSASMGWDSSSASAEGSGSSGDQDE